MVKLAEARQLTPAPAGIGSFAEQLRLAAFNAVKETDIAEIITKQVELAKDGDPAAAKLVLGYLTGGGAPKQVVEKTVVVEKTRKRKVRSEPRVVPIEEAEPPRPVAIESPATRQLRRLVGLYLLQNRDVRASELERLTEVAGTDLAAVLNCDWFTEKNGVWMLTPTGRAAVA